MIGAPPSISNPPCYDQRRMKRLTALLTLLLSMLVVVPATAEEGAPEPGPATEEAPAPEASKLIGKDFRLAVSELDRADPAVRYAHSVRLEGGLLIAGGGVVMGLTLAASAINLLSDQGGSQAPFIAGLGVPAGLALLITGVPAMLGSQNFFAHYLAYNPTTRLGKLKLLRAWRTQLFKLRRDTGLIGSAFLGAIAVLTGVVWAARDGLGVNTGFGGTYNFSDMFTTLAFAGSGGALALFGLVSHLEYTAETETPHRVYAKVSGGLAPMVGRDGGAGISASLLVVF